MIPFASMLTQAVAQPPVQRPLEDIAHAAVAAVFTQDGHLLFMQRAEVDGDPWSGHIAFPGGRAEPEDRDLLATAIRESAEELGLDLSAAESLGPLNDVGTVSATPQMVVRPWVFVLPDRPLVTPNREVASHHWVYFEDLVNDVGRGSFQFDWKGQHVTLPKVDFPGDRVLWGMTLRIVDDLLHRIDGRGLGLARVRTSDP